MATTNTGIKMFDINPADFMLIGWVVNGDSWRDFENRFPDRFSDDQILESNGRCWHCNHRIVHHVTVLNTRTNEIHQVGFTCWNETFSHLSIPTLNLYRIKTIAERKALRLAKEAEKQARLAEIAKWKAEHAELIANLEKYQSNSFIGKMLRAIREWGQLTEKQIAAAQKIINTMQQEVLKPAPTGRVTFTAKIVNFKSYETHFGTAYKMLLQADGFRVFVSVPKDMERWSAEKGYYYTHNEGDEITLTATLSVENDPSFAFGKRPKLVKS